MNDKKAKIYLYCIFENIQKYPFKQILSLNIFVIPVMQWNVIKIKIYIYFVIINKN